MKRILIMVLAMLCVASLCAAEEVALMTHDEYIAAETDTEVHVEAYVQDTQSWWDGKITVYMQDSEGGYFVYNMPCSEEDAAKLVPGQKICVHGYKTVWSGEVEIADVTKFEFIDADPWIAEATDVTDLLADETALAEHMNEKVAVKGAVVAAKQDGAGNEVAYLYKWDGSGTAGDDLYFDVTVGEDTYTFTVESYLRGQDTDVYKAVEGLKVGDVIDLEGYLYWYEGAQPHVISVTVQ